MIHKAWSNVEEKHTLKLKQIIVPMTQFWKRNKLQNNSSFNHDNQSDLCI